MSNTQYGLTYNRPLTNVAQMFKTQRYVADMLLPTVVANTMDGVWLKMDLDIEEANILAGGQNKFREVDLNRPVQNEYSILEKGLSTVITRRVREKYSNYENPRLAYQNWAVEQLTSLIKTGIEKEVMDTLGDAALYSASHKVTLTNEWDDYANSNPKTDIMNGLFAIEEDTTGFGNALVVGWRTAQVLKAHPELKGSVIYNGSESSKDLELSAVAAYLNVERLVVVPAKFKDASGNLTKFFEDKALVAALPEASSDIDDATLACLVRHVEDTPYKVWVRPEAVDGSPDMPEKIFVENNYQFKTLNPNGGYLISNTIS